MFNINVAMGKVSLDEQSTIIMTPENLNSMIIAMSTVRLILSTSLLEPRPRGIHTPGLAQVREGPLSLSEQNNVVLSTL
jgi:hypothetical protein